MKLRVYLLILLLVIPIQASLLPPLSLNGIRPDLAFALVFIIGLLTGPIEGALAGIMLGLLQDVSAASLIGLSGITRGLTGMAAGLLGRQVLDITSPTNVVFLALFSLTEGLFIALMLEVLYGSVPFLSLLWSGIIPQALYTGLIGYFLLQPIKKKAVVTALTRRLMRREA